MDKASRARNSFVKLLRRSLCAIGLMSSLIGAQAAASNTITPEIAAEITRLETTTCPPASFSSVELGVQCQTQAVRPYLAKTLPDLLPYFEAFGLRRQSAAREYDQKKLDSAGLAKAFAAAQSDFQKQVRGAQSPGTVFPNWARQPTAEETLKHYPPLALAARVPGYVVLSCVVTRAGTLDQCLPILESPKGYGFYEAAVQISKAALMTPGSANGEYVEATVQVPFRFNKPQTWLERLVAGKSK